MSSFSVSVMSVSSVSIDVIVNVVVKLYLLYRILMCSGIVFVMLWMWFDMIDIVLNLFIVCVLYRIMLYSRFYFMFGSVMW